MELKFCDIEIRDKGLIGDDINTLNVDFANQFLGGGAISRGSVQEEIMFLQMPECIFGMFVCSRME